jgi:hypothetical protein
LICSFCTAPPIKIPLQFAFELKYVKKSEPHRVESELKEGLTQLRNYLQCPDLQHIVGTDIPLRAWVVVFLGNEVAALSELWVMNYWSFMVYFWDRHNPINLAG